ncbi:MAG: threonine synthase [Gemmatimonadota bacterium]
MNVFFSTRGHGPVTFAHALRQGLAPDGGLYVPGDLPSLESAPPASASFRNTAVWAARALLSDALPAHRLDEAVETALNFPVPLIRLEADVWLLELFHGPSMAFKDVGARFMARAMATLDAEGGAEGAPDARARFEGDAETAPGAGAATAPDAAPAEPRPRTILAATSGDTGSAVAMAFHDLEGYRTVLLFPSDGVSEHQRRQMTTLGGNVTAVAVEGTFDDCQRLAKEAFAAAELARTFRLTSANSINIGRLIPQMFYYLHAAARLGWDAAPARFIVPSGNLGNLCAGLLAHRAGMPAEGFVAATNENRVFPDYLEYKRYAPRASLRTLSNAMDVGAPSNLERLQWLYGNDVAAMAHDITAVSCSDDETLEAIRRAHDRTGVVLDPHTAVGYCALRRVGASAGGPTVLLATAHPGKFPQAVEEAIGRRPPTPPALARILTRPELVVSIAPSVDALRQVLMEESGP